jgi:hypothetical protein
MRFGGMAMLTAVAYCLFGAVRYGAPAYSVATA